MFIQQIFNGLMLGSTYALIAIAFTLLMGILNMLNFAIGEIVKILRGPDQIDRLWHAAGTFRFEPIVRAAEALRSVAPDPIDMFFFMNSGAEAVEASVKLARYVTKRQGVVVFRGGFHGRTMGSVTYTTS